MKLKTQKLDFVLLVFVALLMVLPAFAQETTPEPTVVAGPVIVEDGGTVIVDPEMPPVVPNQEEAKGLAEVILAAAIASVFGTSPATTFIVSLLKRWTPVDARVLTGLTALVIAGLTAVATYFGFGVQFNSLLDTIGVAGPTLVTFIITLIGSAGWYEVAKATNAPVVSYQRS